MRVKPYSGQAGDAGLDWAERLLSKRHDNGGIATTIVEQSSEEPNTLLELTHSDQHLSGYDPATLLWLCDDLANDYCFQGSVGGR